MTLAATRLRQYHKGFDELIYDFFLAIKYGNIIQMRSVLNLDRSLLATHFTQGVNPLLHAVTYNHMDLVQYFDNAGVDLNQTDIFKNSALHISIRNNNILISKYLLSRGALVKCQNWAGKTPLHECNSIKCLIILLNAGADVNKLDIFGNSILYSKN